MHRFYLPPAQCRGERLVLREGEARHALAVLRVRPGERVSVLDGQGLELLCEVREAGRDSVDLEVRQRAALPPLPYRLTLIQAVTKARSMDLTVQKATELGVARLVPVLSARSVVEIAEHAAGSRAEKWRAIAIEAVKQCGSPWLPQIDVPMPIDRWLAAPERFDLVLMASLQPGCRHPRVCLGEFRQEHGRAPASVAVWVGPEGDFTPAELGAIRASGALPITLGPLVLRSETAALYCLSVLGYELQAPGG
jgi:16S rRNA (uracil1498-N3)-methyltransferase